MSSMLSFFKTKAKRGKPATGNKQNLNNKGQKSLQKIKNDPFSVLKINNNLNKPQPDNWTLGQDEIDFQISLYDNQIKQGKKQMTECDSNRNIELYTGAIHSKLMKTLQQQTDFINNGLQSQSNTQTFQIIKLSKQAKQNYLTMEIPQKISQQGKANRKKLFKNRKHLFCKDNTNRVYTETQKKYYTIGDQSKQLVSGNTQSTIDKLKRQIKFLQDSQFVGLQLNKGKYSKPISRPKDLQQESNYEIGRSQDNLKFISTRSNLLYTSRKGQIKSVTSSYSYRSGQNTGITKNIKSSAAISSTNFPCQGSKNRQQINFMHSQFRNKRQKTRFPNKQTSSSSFSMAKKYYSNSKARSLIKKPYAQINSKQLAGINSKQLAGIKQNQKMYIVLL